MNLYPYQQEGARWLAGRKAALLADEMGLGKSAQAIAGCDAVGARDRCVLVICPASVRENWRREFAKFSTTSIRPIVQSYNGVVGQALNLDTPPGDRWDVLILDEAHYLKTHTSKRTKAVFGEKCDGVGGLIERADRVFLLTGTPMPNNPSEMWPALRALAPETIASTSGKPLSYWQYVSKFCKTRDNGFGVQIVGAKNHDKLRTALQPFMLRRRKMDVLPDLPEITFDELYVEGRMGPGGPQAEMIAKALEAEGVDGLRRIATHVATLRKTTGLAKVAPVLDWLGEWLDGCDRKIVLGAQHREVIAALGVGATTAGAQPAILTGDTPAANRQIVVDRFQNDPACRVFIGQLQAAGTGITLTAAADLLFVESSWVPADNSQFAMRIHRIGQRNACAIRFATLAGSIDEQIQRAVARKTADLVRLLD